MNILFIHQNFPGQFKFLAPALVAQGHSAAAMVMQKTQAKDCPEPSRSKITLVRDGIDTQAVAPKADVRVPLTKDLTLTREDEVITFVNRKLEPYRGYHVFMRALPEILRQRPRRGLRHCGQRHSAFTVSHCGRADRAAGAVL